MRFVNLLWIFQNTGVLLNIMSLSLNSPVVRSSFEDVMCLFMYGLCWARAGSSACCRAGPLQLVT